MKRFGFSKAEKLKSRKSIDALFQGGQAFSRFPIRVVYRFAAAEEIGVKVGVSATKKHFKKAVDRNRIKRLLREAYRLQKQHLVEAAREKQLLAEVFFLYNGKELPAFDLIKNTMQSCLDKLQQNILAFEKPA
jgi:ribonuclease P protein component